MHIVVTIQHPAHVHFFRPVVRMVEAEGHRVDVFAREKDLVTYLLDEYGIDYTVLADEPASPWWLPLTQAKYELRLFEACRRLDPDVLVAIGEPGITHVGKLCGATSILLTDTEHARFQLNISVPFADLVCTPASFEADFGDHHVCYEGFHELAYLHPDRYDPNPDIRQACGLDPDRKLAVVRLISWEAAHDFGHSGFERTERLVSALESEGIQVVVTAEGEVPPGLESNQVTVPPEHIHDLLYHADVFVGESGTMTLESAILGTPAVFVATFNAGVLKELESTYGLVDILSGEQRTRTAIRRAKAILETEPSVWSRRRQQLLEDTVDPAAFVHRQLQRVEPAR